MLYHFTPVMLAKTRLVKTIYQQIVANMQMLVHSHFSSPFHKCLFQCNSGTVAGHFVDWQVHLYLSCSIPTLVAWYQLLIGWSISV